MHSPFQSRDEDGGHTIRSAIAENTMLHANFRALSVKEVELLPIEILHCGNRYFLCFFAPITLTLPKDFHIQTWPVFHRDVADKRKWTSYIKAFESYHLTDRQTDRHDRNYIHTQLCKSPKIATMVVHDRWYIFTERELSMTPKCTYELKDTLHLITVSLIFNFPSE